MSDVVSDLTPEKEELAQLDVLTNEPHAIEITDLEGKKYKLVGQTFNTFKTKTILKMLAAVREKVDVITLVAEIVTLAQPADNSDEQAQRTLAAFNAIPKLMEFAPDLLLDLSAIAMIPNREVARAYRDNTLEELTRQNRELLEFEFDASVPLHLFVAYLPYLGIDFLVRELGGLNKAAEKIIPTRLKADTTGS